MRLRIKIVAAFAICIAIPLLAGFAAITLGAQSSLREAAIGDLQAATTSTLNALEERLGQNLANLKAWSALPVMQDTLIADDGGDIARVVATLKAQYPDFAALSVTDSRGIVVATTIEGETGGDRSDDEGFRAAATGRAFQSAFGFRSMGAPETIWLTVPVLAHYDRQTVVGTLTGVLDFSAVAKAVMARSALAASMPTGSHVLVLERRGDGHIVFTSRTDANLFQALAQIDDRGAGAGAEIAWGEKQFFVSTAASKGKGLLRDPGFLARGVAPADSVLAATENLSFVFAAAAGVAALIAMYFAWTWSTPLLQLAGAMTQLARGGTAWRMPTIAPRHAFGDMARALEVFRQTRIVRDRIAAREQELSRQKEEAEAGLRAKSEHLASLSREIRTQLTTIIGMSEMINRETLAAAGNVQYAGYAKDIGRSGVQLLAVINDLFDLSEAEAGHLKLDEADVDIAALARECADLMRDAATKANVLINCDGCDAQMLVRADANKLKQVLFNLLSNAVKFTPENGRVRVGVKALSGGRPAIAVQDNGIGMHANMTPVAMIPFSVTGDASNHGRHGAGFGLPLVRQFMDLHQGSVEIESEIGKGTTVTVTLPAERLISQTGDAPERLIA